MEKTNELNKFLSYIHMGNSIYRIYYKEAVSLKNEKLTDLIVSISEAFKKHEETITKEIEKYGEKATESLTMAGLIGVYKEKMKNFKDDFVVVTSAIKATNMGLISSLKFVSENKALPKSTKKLLFKVIDDYVQIIDELKNYQKSLRSKNEIFIKRLCELGIPVIDQNILAAQGDSDKNHNIYIKINSFGDYAEAHLICEGIDLLFIEYGEGIHYNGAAGSSPHPNGEEFGYTIGSYGQGKGKNDSWVYVSDSGEWVRSYGTEATMPMYKASVEIIQNIRKIAKEVFSS